MRFEEDLKEYADPDCKRCGGCGRYKDYSEDEWGMVLYIRCPCTTKEENIKKARNKTRKKVFI